MHETFRCLDSRHDIDRHSRNADNLARIHCLLKYSECKRRSRLTDSSPITNLVAQFRRSREKQTICIEESSTIFSATYFRRFCRKAFEMAAIRLQTESTWCDLFYSSSDVIYTRRPPDGTNLKLARRLTCAYTMAHVHVHKHTHHSTNRLVHHPRWRIHRSAKIAFSIDREWENGYFFSMVDGSLLFFFHFQ